jgi:RNA polymerase sigma-70 factor (ECF subfamily)
VIAAVDDDAGLVQRCLTGDPVAVRAFVERFHGLVFGLCCRMLGHRHDAEDATQDVFVRALRHLGSWDPARPLRPWLLTIAANRCLTRLSKRSKQPVLVETLAEVPATGLPAASGLAEELQNGLALLRDDYRLCFLLFYEQQLSVQEVAATMDCPEGTVKTWLYRARKSLADYLQQRGVVSSDGYEVHGV